MLLSKYEYWKFKALDMEQKIVEVSPWWFLLAVVLVLLGVWIYHAIKIYRDPEFPVSHELKVSLYDYKEYKILAYEILDRLMKKESFEMCYQLIQNRAKDYDAFSRVYEYLSKREEFLLYIANKFMEYFTTGNHDIYMEQIKAGQCLSNEERGRINKLCTVQLERLLGHDDMRYKNEDISVLVDNEEYVKGYVSGVKCHYPFEIGICVIFNKEISIKNFYPESEYVFNMKEMVELMEGTLKVSFIHVIK